MKVILQHLIEDRKSATIKMVILVCMFSYNIELTTLIED